MIFPKCSTRAARVAESIEWARRWPHATDFYAGYSTYARRTRWEIPLVILDQFDVAR